MSNSCVTNFSQNSLPEFADVGVHIRDLLTVD